MRLIVMLALISGCSAAGVAEDSETWTAPQYMIDAEFKSPTLNAWYGDGASSWYQPVDQIGQFLVSYRSQEADGPHGYLSIMFTREVTTAPVTMTIPACVSIDAVDCQTIDVRYHEDIDQDGRWFAVDVSTLTDVTVRGRFSAN